MSAPAVATSLTELEARVLAQVASGMTNEQIAERLRYSPNYIKDVVMSARLALGARDRAHAAALAVALGVVRVADADDFEFTACRSKGPAAAWTSLVAGPWSDDRRP